MHVVGDVLDEVLENQAICQNSPENHKQRQVGGTHLAAEAAALAAEGAQTAAELCGEGHGRGGAGAVRALQHFGRQKELPYITSKRGEGRLT